MFERMVFSATLWLLCTAVVCVHGQNEQFEMECGILTTLDTLKARLEDYETRLLEQESSLREQDSLYSRLEEQSTRLGQQESRLEEQSTRLFEQESRLGEQSTRLFEQDSRMEEQSTRLLEQEEELVRLHERLQAYEGRGYPKDCGEIFANGTTTSGVHIISPDGSCPFSVYCDMTDDGWTVIQRRIDGAVDFNRTWDEYAQGFGEADGEYWLGLEKIHRLTKDGYELYLHMEQYNGTTEYMHYKSFSVRGASSAFTMDADTFGLNGTLADSIMSRSGNKFSTFDHELPNYCSAETGWWYAYFVDCERPRAHPNGVFGSQGDGGMGFQNGIYAKTFTMKVKQRKHQICS